MKEQEKPLLHNANFQSGSGMSFPVDSGQKVLLLGDLLRYKRLITHYFHIFCLFAQLLNQITG